MMDSTERIENLIGEMTLAEKIGQMTQVERTGHRVGSERRRCESRTQRPH